jgi:hypothetical protein
MVNCSTCHGILEPTRMRCDACGFDLEGKFHLSRLARLAPEQQRMVEQMVLAGGNLKEVAEAMDVSYPTLRKRLDVLIAALRQLQKDDDTRAKSLLDEVEAGRLPPEAAARLIKEMSGAI